MTMRKYADEYVNSAIRLGNGKCRGKYENWIGNGINSREKRWRALFSVCYDRIRLRNVESHPYKIILYIISIK